MQQSAIDGTKARSSREKSVRLYNRKIKRCMQLFEATWPLSNKVRGASKKQRTLRHTEAQNAVLLFHGPSLLKQQKDAPEPRILDTFFARTQGRFAC